MPFASCAEPYRLIDFAACFPPDDPPSSPYLRLHSIGHFDADSTYLVRRHHLPQWLFGYTLSGCGQVIYQGARATIPQGSALLIDCSAPHTYASLGGQWEFLWLHFTGSVADALAAEVNRRRGLAFPASADCAGLWQATRELAVRTDAAGLAGISAQVYRLLCTLLIEQPIDERIAAAQAYVQRHYAAPITIEDLARAACLSPYHFHRRFKAETGCTPHRYLCRYRIARAQELLVATDLPIARIAAAVGFATVSYFSAAFKELSGCTPRSYRQNVGVV